MQPIDRLFATAIVLAWSFNFIVAKYVLQELPPFLLGGIRFVLVVFPAIFFVPRPKLPWRIILYYGLTISLGQFGLLFLALHVGMPAGLASLVLQTGVFFTVILSAFLLREKMRRGSILGIMLAFCGLLLCYYGGTPEQMSRMGLILTLLAALSWAVGNIVLKRAQAASMISLVVWGGLVPPLPFFLLSLWLEGPALISQSLLNITWVSVASLFYLVFIATGLAYALWGLLYSRYAISRITPITLYVPVVSMLLAYVFLNEILEPLQWLGVLIVFAGLYAHTQALRG